MVKDFEIFKKEFKKWQDKFGLNGWKVFFRYEDLGSDRHASLSYDLSGMVASAKLNSNLPDTEKQDKDPALSAKHEAIHLLLARLESYAMVRYVTANDIEEADEELVYKLEGLL